MKNVGNSWIGNWLQIRMYADPSNHHRKSNWYRVSEEVRAIATEQVKLKLSSLISASMRDPSVNLYITEEK